MVSITQISTVVSLSTWLLGYLKWGNMTEQLHHFLYCSQIFRSLVLMFVGGVADISFLNQYTLSFHEVTQQQSLSNYVPPGIMPTILFMAVVCWMVLLSKIVKEKEESNQEKSILEQLLQEKENQFQKVQKKQQEESEAHLNLETALKDTQDKLNQLHQTVTQVIHERQQIEIELNNRIQQQSVAAKLSQRGLEGIDLSLLMDEAMILVVQTLGVDYSNILELLPNGTAFFFRAGVGWKEGIVKGATVSAQENSHAGYTFSVNEPVVIEDLLIETRFSSPAVLLNHQIISGVSLEIPGKKKAFGILGVYTKEQRKFSEDEIHFLQAIANILATAIERKKAEERLHLLERAINASSNGIVIADAIQSDNPVIYLNKTFERLTGYQAEEVLGRNCRFLQGNDTNQPALTYLRQKIQEGQECQIILRNYRKDGTRFWNELHIAPVHSSEGYLTHYIGIQTDITERKQAEEALRESEKRINSILGSLKDIVWSVSAKDFKTLYLNPATEKVYGYSRDQFFKDSEFWLKVVHPEDQERVINSTRSLIETGSKDLEYRIVRPDGEIRWLHDRGRAIYDETSQPTRFDGIATDITERKRMEEQLLHDAFHDSLTGLPNRALFMDRLREAFQESKGDRNALFAVLFLDLDRFKVVNDSVGHGVGDKLLVAIARQLEKFVSPTDTVARLGGDEFSILLKKIKDIQEAIVLAEKIHRTLNSPFNLEGYDVFSTVSIGIALSSEDYDDPTDLLRDADTAMYYAKEQGKSCHQVFNPSMHTDALVRLQLETDLRRAIFKQEFLVYYQPIISLSTGKLTGFEALLRWEHPEHGFISPADFIPIAEETGLIIPIGAWILEQSCYQMKLWQEKFPDQMPLSISVNLSGKQLREADLIDQIDEILEDTALDGHWLKLEITESMLMDNAEVARQILTQLRARNIHLCIDDFGTGYSSLSYLNRFPVNTLKVDRSFVSRMQADDENAEIVRAIVRLAHSLGMDVIAEGVETRSQWLQLKALGCEQGQGYFFAKPLDQEAAEALIAQSLQW